MSALKSAVVLAASLGLLGASGCASGQLVAKTIDQGAIILCDVFFAAQPANATLSVEDVEKAFCATAEQLAPFLDAAKAAVNTAGKAREASGK
jgi:hypothetical protein